MIIQFDSDANLAFENVLNFYISSGSLPNPIVRIGEEAYLRQDAEVDQFFDVILLYSCRAKSNFTYICSFLVHLWSRQSHDFIRFASQNRTPNVKKVKKVSKITRFTPGSHPFNSPFLLVK